MQFLTFSEIKSKTTLKNQIIKGQIKVYEKDYNNNIGFVLINTNCILSLWHGFHFPKKFNQDTEEAYAYLGTSFTFKFSK